MGRRHTVVFLTLLFGLLGTRASAETPTKLTVGLYAPSAGFADSSARLHYVQALARAIQTKTGIATTGKAYVRFADLIAAKPDFAVIEGVCISAKSPGQVLATASIDGDTALRWALYARGNETVRTLKGKKLAYMKTGCRDADFLDNAMLESDIKTSVHFGDLVDKADVGAAVATVRDYKAADAVFAPSALAKGLTKVYDGGIVPNPGFVALSKLDERLLGDVKGAILASGGGGQIDGWKGAASYAGLTSRLATRTKKGVFAAPQPVKMEEETDVLVVPKSELRQSSVKHHFWQPPKRTTGE